MINHFLIIFAVLTASGYFYNVDLSEKSELIDKLYTGMAMV